MVSVDVLVPCLLTVCLRPLTLELTETWVHFHYCHCVEENKAKIKQNPTMQTADGGLNPSGVNVKFPVLPATRAIIFLLLLLLLWMVVVGLFFYIFFIVNAVCVLLLFKMNSALQ